MQGLIWFYAALAIGISFPIHAQIQDPLRIIDGKKIGVSGKEWYVFRGTVLQNVHDGLMLSDAEWDNGSGDAGSGSLFIRHFPYQVEDGAFIDCITNRCFCARDSDLYQYTSVLGATRTVHSLEYGKIWNPPPPAPPTSSEIAAAKAKAAADKAKASAAALKFNQEAAARGDAYGQLRIGERYLTGDGVQKDLAKARSMFVLSAAQGNQAAADHLKQLLASPATSQN